MPEVDSLPSSLTKFVTSIFSRLSRLTFARLSIDDKDSDLRIECQGKLFNVHQAVMYKKSKYFASAIANKLWSAVGSNSQLLFL